MSRVQPIILDTLIHQLDGIRCELSQMQDIFIDQFLRGVEGYENFDAGTQDAIQRIKVRTLPLIIEHGKSLILLREITSQEEFIQYLDAVGLDLVAAQDAIDTVKEALCMEGGNG